MRHARPSGLRLPCSRCLSCAPALCQLWNRAELCGPVPADLADLQGACMSSDNADVFYQALSKATPSLDWLAGPCYEPPQLNIHSPSHNLINVLHLPLEKSCHSGVCCGNPRAFSHRPLCAAPAASGQCSTSPGAQEHAGGVSSCASRVSSPSEQSSATGVPASGNLSPSRATTALRMLSSSARTVLVSALRSGSAVLVTVHAAPKPCLHQQSQPV